MSLQITFEMPLFGSIDTLSDMLLPLMPGPTLKHIVVNFRTIDYDSGPLFRTLLKFEDLRNKNIVETITIGIKARIAHSSCRGDDWGRLDEVLTAPGWFSLKRVSVAIEITLLNDISNSMLEVELRETHFLRLSSSNSVLFDFEVTILDGGSRLRVES